MRKRKKSRTIFHVPYVVGALLFVGLGTLGVYRPQQTARLQDELVHFAQPFAENLLRLNNITVEGNEKVSTEKVIENAGLKYHPWAWQIPLSEIASRVNADPWIETTELSWGLAPLRLAIIVHEARPWLVVDCGDVSWLVSKNREIIGSLARLEGNDFADLSELPRLRGIQNEGELNGSNTQLAYALQMISSLEAAGGPGYPISSYELLDQGIRVEPDDPESAPSVSLVANDAEGVKKRLEQFSKVSADLKKRGERAREVDLRFDGQAVVR